MAGTDLSFNISALDRASATFIKLADTVDKLGAKLDELGAKEAKPEVDIQAAKAKADLDALTAHLDEIGKKRETAKVDVDTKDAVDSVNNFAGKATLITAAVAAAAPAAGAAILAGLGGAFAAVGILAEKSNAQVKQSFADLEASAKSSLTNGFAPLVPTIVGVTQDARNALSNLEGDFEQAAKSTAPLLEAVGVDLVAATHRGVTDMTADLSSLAPVAKAVGQDFLDVEAGIQGLLKNLDVGGSAQTLALLGQAAKEDLPALGNLVAAITPLTNTLLTVLIPAIRDTANDLSYLKPIFQAVEAVVTPLAPALGAIAPPALALLGVSKLLTGSWFDLGGAARALTGPFTDVRGSMTSVANAAGVTTAAQNSATKAGLAQAASAAALKASLTEEASAQALVTLQTEGSVKSVYELDAALAAQVAASNEAAAAQETLAAAEETASVAMGPLGLVLAAAGIAFMAFVGNAGHAATAAQDMTGEVSKLQQAAGQGTMALAQLFGQDAGAKALMDTLQKYGVTVQDLTEAQNGNVAAQQKVAAATKQALDATKDKLTIDQASLAAMKAGVSGVNEYGQTMGTSADAIKAQQRAVDADSAAVNSASQVYQDAQAQVRNTTAALAQQGVTLSATQQLWNQQGTAIQSSANSFNQATSGLKYLFDAENTSITTAGQAADAQKQLRDAVVSAQAAYQSAAQGVAQADHQVEQAAESVTNARHSEQSALENVSIAEDTYQKSITSEVTAQRSLIAARAAAAQQLADLQRQLTDQGDTVASARLNLLDAQTAVTSAGLAGKSLGNFGPLTTQNEAQYKLLLQLSQAQHSYNDAVAQSQKLQTDNSAAQAAGINGSSQVIAAQNQIASTHDAVAKAAKGVSDAQYQAQQAGLALKNAQYEQQIASQAVQQATLAEQTARIALTVAQGNNTTTVQGNTVQAANNRSAIEQMFEANVALYGPTVQATQATEQQGNAAGYTEGQVDGVIGSLGGLNGTISQFGIVGTPSLNLNALIQQAGALGIPLNTLGFTPGQIQAAAGVTPINNQGHGKLSPQTKADGGHISGPGGPRDDLIPAWLSDGEFVVNADAAARHRGLLETINARGYADGGAVTPQEAMAANLRLSLVDGLIAATAGGMHAFGVHTNPDGLGLPPTNSQVDFGPWAYTGGGGSGPGYGSVAAQSGSAAAAQAFAAAHLAQFGWGQDQMPPLIRLWNQESGWNANAVNRSSGAYGIPQSLGHGHPYNLGDYANQVLWGLNYIKGRYGSPAAAWGHEQAFNWYSMGGLVKALMPPAGSGGGGSAPVARASGGTVSASASSGDRHFHLTVHNAANNSVDLQAQYRRMEIMAAI